MKMINGLMYGENPREGFERDGMFYHPDMEFKFPVPDGFSVINQPSAVILVNETQDAVVQFSLDNENETPEASVKAFLSQEGVETLESDQGNVNGYANYTAEASVVTEDGTSLWVDISAIEFSGMIFRFLSYTTADKTNEYRGAFNKVSSGFSKLTDSSILSIQPVRLQVTKTQRSGSFSSFLPNPLPMGIEPEDIAILNQVSLDQTISRGTLIKIPKQ